MKLLIVKNEITQDISNDVAKAIAYHSSHTGFTYEIEYMETSFVPTFTTFGTSTFGTLIYGTDNIKGQLRPLIPPSKYDMVLFFYENERTDLFGLCFWNGLYVGTEYIEIPISNFTEQSEWFWKAICHEMMHAYCQLLNGIKGIRVLFDEMDLTTMPDGRRVPYYMNDPTSTDPDSNFNHTWKNITPYLSLFTMPTVTITRLVDTGKETLGDLSAGTFNSKSLELPWKNNQRGISCIPKGTYDLQWTFSPKFLKYTYEVINVPNRSGIRLHSANFFFDLNGCIAQGNGYANLNNDGQVDVINSRLTMRAFEDYLQKKPAKLVIQ